MRPKVIANCTRSLAKGGAKRGIRLGARGLSQFRNVKVHFGKTYGSCEVVFEPGTRVFAQVSATIGEPNESRPGEGAVSVSVWVSPAATGDMVGSSGRPSLIARSLERLFKENRAVDLESLCIKFGEKAWIVKVDVHVLDMNGCLQEAAALAVLGGILTFRRPNAFVDPDTDELVVQSMEESTPVKLHLFHLPMLTSFAICEGKLLAEPSYEEEEIFTGKLVIGITDSKEICYLHLTNPLDEDLLLEATKLAQNQCIKRVNWFKELCGENITEREVPLYLRPQGPRTTGAVLDFKDLSATLSSLSLSNLKIKKEGSKSLGTIPSFKKSDIRILDNLCL